MLSLEPEKAFRDAVGADYRISIKELFTHALSALECRGWNGRRAASSLVKALIMSRQEASELLGHLTTRPRPPSAESLSYLEHYASSPDTPFKQVEAF